MMLIKLILMEILIGETGSLPPDYICKWGEQKSLYHTRKHSTMGQRKMLITVRIYNLIGGMGMWEGPYTIEPLGWIDEVSVSHSFMETAKNSFSAKITFTNKTDNTF